MKKKGLFLIYLIFGLLVITNAQEPAKTMQFTLKEAQDYAITNSYVVKNAMIDIAKAEKKVWETTAIGLPTAEAEIKYQNIFEKQTMAFPGFQMDNTVNDLTVDNINENIRLRQTMHPVSMGEVGSTTIDFTISQLIFSGEYIVGLQASKTYKQLSKQSYEKAKTDIVADVATGYHLVLILNENIKTLQGSVDNLKSMVSEMEKMLSVGFVEDTDVDQLKLTLNNIQNTISNLERQLTISENLLKFQMGLKLEQEIVLKDQLDNIITSTEVAGYITSSLSLQENINYKLSETQVKLQELNLKREKSTILPSVSAFFRYQKLVDEPEINFTPPKVFGVNVKIPIFASGTRYTKIAQERMELEKTRNSKLQAEDGLILEHAKAKSELENAWKNYLSEKSSMELSKKIYDKTYIKYKEGISSSMDLTQAQNQYLDSQSKYYNAVLEMLNAKTDIEKLLTKANE